MFRATHRCRRAGMGLHDVQDGLPAYVGLPRSGSARSLRGNVAAPGRSVRLAHRTVLGRNRRG